MLEKQTNKQRYSYKNPETKTFDNKMRRNQDLKKN